MVSPRVSRPPSSVYPTTRSDAVRLRGARWKVLVGNCLLACSLLACPASSCHECHLSIRDRPLTRNAASGVHYPGRRSRFPIPQFVSQQFIRLDGSSLISARTVPTGNPPNDLPSRSCLCLLTFDRQTDGSSCLVGSLCPAALPRELQLSRPASCQKKKVYLLSWPASKVFRKSAEERGASRLNSFTPYPTAAATIQQATTQQQQNTATTANTKETKKKFPNHYEPNKAIQFSSRVLGRRHIARDTQSFDPCRSEKGGRKEAH